MKKFISLITGSMLAIMSMIPATVTADSEEKAVATSPATVAESNLTAVFARNQPEYDVYVGEEIDLNSIILNLYVYGYSPDGNFIPEPVLLNYSFSLGSGEHSDCYNYYLDYVDTSKAGRYLIQCKLKGGAKETFDIENSGCPDIPDGKYEMIMSNSNFAIPINVIEPYATAPESPAPVTTTGTRQTSPYIATTTAVTADFQPVTEVLPPVRDNEIRAMYTCQETYTVSVGETFNPDDIELSVYARGTNQYQIDYRFTIGSGKHSDCFTYDAGAVDTSKPGTYYVKVEILPNVKDTYVIDSTNSCNLPEGEYEMITEGITMYSMIPVHVTPAVSVLGDANEDNKVNIADVASIIQHIGNQDDFGLSEQGLANADTNSDGIVTGADAVAIQMLMSEQITELPYTE